MTGKVDSVSGGVSPLAGKPAPAELLTDIPRLITAYFANRPDPKDKAQQVAFGTSGHRGSSLTNAFNEWHILSITQAICDYRRENDITGPLFIGRDTHALSEPAQVSALEVLAANGVPTLIAGKEVYTPTPAISHAILAYNRGRSSGLADGIVITPSHNPPQDGGFKYNPPDGGPASGQVTGWIQDRANRLILDGLRDVRRVPYEKALRSASVQDYDYLGHYVADLENVLDMPLLAGSGVRMGVDPLGGAAVSYWGEIADHYGLDLTVISEVVDPTFRFMAVDRDGKIRMDPSSSYVMAPLIKHQDRFDVAFACDTDHDRHGIIARSSGLMPPNAYLATCIDYLFRHRNRWSETSGVGKTLVSSAMIDRVAARLGRRLVEVPVGFKWFVEGLLEGSLGFAGEESAGASFLRGDGTVWTTDKDGIIAALLAGEMTARSGSDPGERYAELCRTLGNPVYARRDAPAQSRQKQLLGALDPQALAIETLAGEPVTRVLNRAPGNGAPIGGIKVEAENGWFAARPSGTEDIYKIYAESFSGQEHLDRIIEEAQALVDEAIA